MTGNQRQFSTTYNSFDVGYLQTFLLQCSRSSRQSSEVQFRASSLPSFINFSHRMIIFIPEQLKGECRMTRKT